MASDQGITSRHDHSVTDRTPDHIGLPFAPRVPLRAALAELIFRAGFRTLPVRVILPDGQRWGGGGADTPVMYLARPAEFFRRIGTDANIGLGEAYQAGDWVSPDLVDLLTVSADRLRDSALGTDPAPTATAPTPPPARQHDRRRPTQRRRPLRPVQRDLDQGVSIRRFRVGCLRPSNHFLDQTICGSAIVRGRSRPPLFT